MSSISGLEFDYNKKNITGIYEITDGGGSTMINGVINCNSLYIDGIPCLPGTTGTPGPTGPSGTIQVGTTITLSAGSNAYVTDTGTLTNAIFNFGIPQGIQGIQGITGTTGATGADGASSTITVGTTTTLDAGSLADVTDTGTINNGIFNFFIPKGDKGDDGARGHTGSKGDKGNSGSDGTNGTNGSDGASGIPEAIAFGSAAGAAAGATSGAAAGAVAGASAGAEAGAAVGGASFTAIELQVNQLQIDVGILSTDVNVLQTQMISANTRMTEIEATQLADQTAFSNQIATIDETLLTHTSQITALTGRVTQLELEMGGFNLSNGFFNQF